MSVLYLKGVTVKLYVADLQNDIIQEPPVSVRAYHAQTVSQFKSMVAEVRPVDKWLKGSNRKKFLD